MNLGFDLIPDTKRIAFYPYIGFRMVEDHITGKSSEGKILDTQRRNFDLPLGVGFKWWMGSDSDEPNKFAYMDVNAQISHPLINGKWKKEGAPYMIGAYNPKLLLTIAIGIDWISSNADEEE